MSKRIDSKKENAIDTNMIDSIATNLNITVVKAAKVEKSKKVISAIAEKLNSIDSTDSKKLTKAIKENEYKFSAIRSNILAQIANDSMLKNFDNSKIIAILRASKKDSALYVTLRKIAAFSYKSIKTTENDITTINLVKSFSVKSVVRSCEIYYHLTENDSAIFNEKLIADILHENELNAVNLAEKRVLTLQTQCNDLQNLIEQLKDTAKIEKAELSDKLLQTEKQLTIAAQIFEYCKFATNRNLII